MLMLGNRDFFSHQSSSQVFTSKSETALVIPHKTKANINILIFCLYRYKHFPGYRFELLTCFLFVLRYVFLLLILFLVPGIVMTLAYGLISLELYRGIKFEMDNRKANRGED